MKLFYLPVLFVLTFSVRSQVIINAYAKVTSVSNSRVLAVSNVNQANHTFAIGQKVIVMQMQDNVIGTNTGNSATFGNLSAISSAGLYEVRIISARTPATGNPTSITLSVPLSNTYNTGTNSSVQIITLRNMGTNFTTTSDITGLEWNGNVGGVIGIEVGNTLTLNHRIIADGIGFAGGQRSDDADETCDEGSYRVNDANKAYKGEGIFKRTTANQTNGRAKIINGGGGGSENNSGGGGGGNFTAGGRGGLGYQCNDGNSGYGLGGVTLSTSISSSRVFMGGGGGGGQENNALGSDGGNGGGIILVKANVVTTNATCINPIRISANGVAAANSSNDGSGGGGAGGSIVFDVNSYSISNSCPLINSAGGGKGGSVTDAASHGGGGGGGQGVVIYSIPLPTTNITTSVTNGAPGADNSGGTTSATGGTGNNGAGTMVSGTGPLPIELVNFSAEKQSTQIKLAWLTATEKDNDYFTIERSKDAESFEPIDLVDGAGTSRSYKNYVYYDTKPVSGISYYRLKQTDFSGEFKYSPLVSVNYEKIKFSISPNPVELDQSIKISIDKGLSGSNVVLRLFDLTAKEIISKTLDLTTDEGNQLNLFEYSIQPGVYILKLETAHTSDFKKLIIK